MVKWRGYHMFETFLTFFRKYHTLRRGSEKIAIFDQHLYKK